MSTSLEEMHELPLHIRFGRARAGVIMLIISDFLSILALLAAGGYLSTLNVLNQYRLPSDHPPALLPGILATVALVVSGLAYYWWERRGSQPVIFILSLLLMVASLMFQFWLGLSLGYAAPFHAYESVILLLTWYSAFHLALTAFIGLLLLGRILRGRLVGHPYISEVVGYWWYYTVVAGLVMWAFSMLLV
ncbi:MAG TPA: hypothetical protein VEV19_04040 [Ktedonobacteraceae bacterium]|nr:hypothetical protein [Ktedonobacteraceae bacterium]